MPQLNRVKNIAAAVIAATMVAAAPAISAPIVKPQPRRALQVTMIEDAGETQRAPDIYDEDFEADPSIEARVAAATEARLALTRRIEEPKLDNFPARMELSRTDSGFRFETAGGVHQMPLCSIEEAEAVNARIRALVHPGFKEPHYAC